MQQVVIESMVSCSCIKGRVSDARPFYQDVWAEPAYDGTYNVVAILGAKETSVRAETSQAAVSPVP